jgi:hypothetical protein
MKKAPSAIKRGISSIFIAIYLALIVITFGVTLFSSIQISNASMMERLRIEQEKEQEALMLQTGSITVVNNIIDSINITNTGSITLRIRGIYIGYNLVSDLSTTDEYINPQKSLEIDISNANVPLGVNEFLPITITTERGTSFTKIIHELLGSPTGDQSEDSICGPIKLIWDQFHWTYFSANFNLQFLRSAGTVWNGGWSVVPNNYVIWRIRIQNVDKYNREIQLGNKSSLILVSNEVGSVYTFYIDMPCSDKVIRPNQYAAIYFVWKIPEPTSRVQSNAKATPQATGPDSARTCITFLLLEGKIGDTSLGQTIPFQAVLLST